MSSIFVVKATLYGSGVSLFEHELAHAAPMYQFKRFIQTIRSELLEDNITTSTDAAPAEHNPLTTAVTDDEWNEVAELIQFLKIPFEMTRRLEGSNNVSEFGSLWQSLTNLQHLWLSYQSASEQPHTSEYLSSAISFGFEKFNTYSKSLVMEHDPSFYVVATALHPKMRFTWFKTHWKYFPLHV